MSGGHLPKTCVPVHQPLWDFPPLHCPTGRTPRSHEVLLLLSSTRLSFPLTDKIIAPRRTSCSSFCFANSDITRTPLSVLGGPPTTASFQFIDCPPNYDGKSLYYAGVLAPDQQYSDAKLNPAKQTVSDIPVKDLRGSELLLSLEQHGLQFLPFPYYLSLRSTQTSKRSCPISTASISP